MSAYPKQTYIVLHIYYNSAKIGHTVLKLSQSEILFKLDEIVDKKYNQGAEKNNFLIFLDSDKNVRK